MSSEATGPAVTDGPAVDTIQGIDLPDEVSAVIASYEAAGGERDRFLWQWIYDLLPSFTLSCVPESRAGAVRVLKTKLTVLVTALDDVAESSGDARTFEALRSVVRGGGDTGRDEAGVDAEIVGFVEDLWADIEGTLRDAPRYDEFRPVYEYDFEQTLNAMDYARIVNEHPAVATLAGMRRFGSHNMVAFPYADVDLMHSPGFDRADLGPTREVLWDLQTMARIGNWLTTWKREVREGDLSSGVVVYAIQHGLVAPEEVVGPDADSPASVVERIETNRVPALFESEWRQLHRRVSEREFETTSVDLDALVAGMETVMAHHLAGEGHK